MVTCLAYSVLMGLIFAAIFFLFLSGRYSYTISGKHIRLFVNSRNIVSVTDERFLSFGLDTSFLGCMFHQLKPDQWKKLEEFTNLLSPAYLRVGGKHTDRLYFTLSKDISPNDYHDCTKNFGPASSVTLTGDNWIKLYSFAQRSKVRILMSMNAMLRIYDRKANEVRWNSTNAEDLINFSESKEVSFDVQLGNGPDNDISAERLGNDYDILKAILDSSSGFKNAMAVGPDVSVNSLNFLGDFLSSTEGVDAVSWKQYYITSARATLPDFINPDTYDRFSEEIKSIKRVIHRINKTLPVWLTETNSVYNGGVPGLSDGYAAAFMWLDKLGVAAKSGVKVVIRQFLFNDQYSLISPHFTPSVDFYISYFYKHLVGTKVLNMEFKNSNTKTLRFYAHCLSHLSPIKAHVVVFGMNLINKTEIFLTTGIQLKYPIYSYTFRPANIYNVTSKEILLNNKLLKFNYENIYEELKNPMPVKLPLVVPSFSINFWIFEEKLDTVAKSVCG